ncbi:hypothetical protein [Paraburkholderia unamae]|uniref:Uncharacterized protein n=1 Tax=Paraburkholderia unamae TaxID=219649 RepID=A0ABX5KCF2_9BURK|nr:hypothetical protein [Paraburkholderia unamae]PVX73618.1 hypothetical protein C7402_121111 [Paraburkholderia unamae]RAR56177.1 hypothetical protein C7401_12041 [Paraburkholderia unamae]CAG9254457.1 conserved hypothetical protein [Paraburkholderia unamae]
MELVVVAAIVAVSFGAAATWLLATRLPERWLEKNASEGRYAHLGMQEASTDEADTRRIQARNDTRRVRRERVRARLQTAARMMRALRPAATRQGRGPAARP